MKNIWKHQSKHCGESACAVVSGQAGRQRERSVTVEWPQSEWAVYAAHCALGGDRYTTHQHKCHAHILDTAYLHYINPVCSGKLEHLCLLTSHLLRLRPSPPQQTDKMCGFKVSLVKWRVLVLRFCRSIDFPIIFRYTRVRQRHETCHKTDIGHRDLVS